MATVTILRGKSRGQLIKNQTFTLLEGFKVGARTGEGFVTVDGTALYGRPKARIKVKSSKDFVVKGEIYNSNQLAALKSHGLHVDANGDIVDVNGDNPIYEKGQIQEILNTAKIKKSPLARRNAAANKTVEAVNLLEDNSIPDVESTESDEEVLARISKRFGVLDKLTLGARRGDIRALFVTGAPGVGKTFGVERTLGEAGMIEQFEDTPKRYEIVSGAMTPIGLYMKLYEFSGANDVLVLDDCDMVFTDETALNILKAALDTSKVRKIYWNVASHMLKKEDIPNDFEFNGSVIFISNINFRKVRGERLRGHLSALMSRAHFLDLTVHTFREKMLRIEDLVANKGMLDQFNLTKKASKEVMEFIRKNATQFNELSLRTVIKLAGLVKTCNEDTAEWQEIAEMSLMGNELHYS